MTTVASSVSDAEPGSFRVGCVVSSGIGMEVVGSPAVGGQGWVHAHHKQHWADGGPTDLCNLILLCGYHHRFLHEHEWTIEDDPTGRSIFRKPDGQVYPPVRTGLDPRLRALVEDRS